MVVDLHGKFMGVRRSKVWAGKHFIAVSSRQIESSALSGKEGKARARGVIFQETGQKEQRAVSKSCTSLLIIY